MYIGFAAIGVFAILLWSFLSGREPQMITAMVPVSTGPGIQAFREVTPDDLQVMQIPADTALENQIVTKQWYEAVTTGANWDALVGGKATPGPLFTVTNLLPGQIIDRQALQQNPSASYQIVLPDERVVGVTTDLSGAMAGTLKAGDVVTAIADSGSNSLTGEVRARFAKIISIGIGANAGKGVAGTTAPIAAGDGAAGIQVLLAVAKDDGPLIAGKSVRMVLNPFCAVVGAEPAAGAAQETQPNKDKAIGQIVPVEGRETGCQVPTNRAAGANAAQ